MSLSLLSDVGYFRNLQNALMIGRSLENVGLDIGGATTNFPATSYQSLRRTVRRFSRHLKRSRGEMHLVGAGISGQKGLNVLESPYNWCQLTPFIVVKPKKNNDGLPPPKKKLIRSIQIWVVNTLPKQAPSEVPHLGSIMAHHRPRLRRWGCRRRPGRTRGAAKEVRPQAAAKKKVCPDGTGLNPYKHHGLTAIRTWDLKWHSYLLVCIRDFSHFLRLVVKKAAFVFFEKKRHIKRNAQWSGGGSM